MSVTNLGSGAGASVSPGSVSLTSASFPAEGIDIRVNPVEQSDVSGMDATKIMGILHGLDTEGVLSVAQAHLRLGEKLEQIATRLTQNAHTLAQNWQGTAAQTAMNKFQEMHDQTALLAAQAKQTGQVLQWLGSDVLPKYKSLPDPRVESRTQSDEQTGAKIGDVVDGAPGALLGDGMGAIASAFGIGGNDGQAKANAQAQKYLTALNEHLIQANNALPSPIGMSMSFPSSGRPSPSTGSGSDGNGAYGASGSALRTPASSPGGVRLASGTEANGVKGTSGRTLSGAGIAPSAGRFSPALPPHAGTGKPGLESTGSLQGFTPPPGATSPGPVPGGTTAGLPGPGTGAPVPPPSVPVPGGLSYNGSGSGAPDDGGVPPDEELAPDGTAAGQAMAPDGTAAADGTVADAALGTPAAQAVDASALGAGGTADTDMAGIPMMGGSGSGQQERERRRESWMNEDEDFWGFPADHVPSVIEGGG